MRRALLPSAALLLCAWLAWFYAHSIVEQRLLRGRLPQMAPLPATLKLPPGVTVPPTPRASDEQMAKLDQALVRDPLDPRLLNLHFVQRTLREGSASPAVQSELQLVSRLGWRHTPAQQNLMVRAALENRLGEVLDRIDALLRRQRATPQIFNFLGVVEATPEFRPLVIKRLSDRVPWRESYLMNGGNLSDPRAIDARFATLETLLDRGHSLTRREIGPFLTSAVAAGRGERAYRLWTRQARQTGPAGSVVFDADFRHAQALGPRPVATIPFEWQFSSGLGYRAAPSGRDRGGASLSWDGRGAPEFMYQLVRLQPGRAMLTVTAGEADTASQALAFALRCPSTNAEFELAGAADGTLRYVADARRLDCGVARLTVEGRPLGTSGPVTIHLARVELTSSRSRTSD